MGGKVPSVVVVEDGVEYERVSYVDVDIRALITKRGRPLS